MILVTSDWHGHNWPRFASVNRDGVNSRFGHLLGALDQIEKLIAEHGPDALLMLGDLTHRRYFVQFSIYTPIAAWFAKIRERYGIRIYLLKGNHDEEGEQYSALGPLAYQENIWVVERPMWLEVPSFSQPAFFVPYMKNPAAVIDTASGHGRTLFAHYALDGKVLDNEYRVPTALPLSHLDPFDRIILGHVHSPSVEHDGRVIYVGAPLHMDFGDVGPRYAWFLDETAARPVELTAPRFVTTNYPRLPNPPACGGYLRILGTPPRMMAEVKKAGLAAGWLAALPMRAEIPKEAVRILSSPTFVDEQVVRDWVAAQYPELDQDARDRILAFGLACLAEARQ